MYWRVTTFCCSSSSMRWSRSRSMSDDREVRGEQRAVALCSRGLGVVGRFLRGDLLERLRARDHAHDAARLVEHFDVGAHALGRDVLAEEAMAGRALAAVDVLVGQRGPARLGLFLLRGIGDAGRESTGHQQQGDDHAETDSGGCRGGSGQRDCAHDGDSEARPPPFCSILVFVGFSIVTCFKLGAAFRPRTGRDRPGPTAAPHCRRWPPGGP